MQKAIMVKSFKSRSRPLLKALLISILVSNTLLGNNKKKWIVATEADYPPFSYTENGNIRGYNQAIVHEIAETMQFELEVQIGPWNEIRSKLEAGKIDAIVGMYYSPERDKLVDFSPPIFVINHAVFSRAGVPPLKEESDLKGKKVCVMEGDIMHDYMRKHYPDTKLLFCDTIKEGLEKLENGEFDYVVMARIPSHYWVSKLNLHKVQESPFLIRPSRYCLAVQEGNTDFLSLLEEGLTTIEFNGKMMVIRNQWLSPLETHIFDLKTVFHWALLTIGPLVLLLGMILIWSILLRKRVAQKTSELEESREHYKITLQSIGDAVITTDSNGRVTGLNPVAEALTQWETEEALGHPLGEVFNIVNALTGKGVENPVEKVLSTGYIVGI